MSLRFKFIFLILIPFLVSTSRLGGIHPPPLSSYNYSDPDALLKARQISATILTRGATGGQGPNGRLPLRREIRELEGDNITWSLYILGLDRLQHIDQTEKISWYNIAGIHGRPFKTFDGVEGPRGSQNTGYCTHVSILFPTWHRPYLALYEQILHGLVQDIAQQYPAGNIRDTYTAAAVNFRIPYWDWAANQFDRENILPNSIAGSPIIEVSGPAGRQSISNPLFSYRFQQLDPVELPNAPFNGFLETIRYPDSNGPTATSRNGVAALTLESNAVSIRSRLYTILTNYHDYLAFSNGGYRAEASPSEQDSLEAIHDQVHALVGGGGHMSFIDYAGFDPVFFLHHAMVDRCFAMWQTLNPNSYVVPRVAVTPTFTLPAGQIQDTNTPLTPFFKDTRGNFWTSSDVRDTKVFGYDYSETSNPNMVRRKQDVIMTINRLYGPSSRMKNLKRDVDAQSISAAGKYREWVANLQMPKSVQNLSYSVYIFLGPFDEDPSSWPSNPNLAGLHTTFEKTIPVDEEYEMQSPPIVTAAIPLTSTLIRYMQNGELESLSVEDVRGWLDENLNYRILLHDGTILCEEDLPSFKLSVASAEVKLPYEYTDMPVWGEMMEHS